MSKSYAKCKDIRPAILETLKLSKKTSKILQPSKTDFANFTKTSLKFG
ncbi:hypothetical protein [Helicobacter sp. T3_23-1056]